MKTLAVATCVTLCGFAITPAAWAAANMDIVATANPAAFARPAAKAVGEIKTASLSTSDESEVKQTKTRKGVRKAKNGALRYESHKRSRVADLIARHAAAAGVPVQLADAVIRIESRYNPAARNGGAVGLMQIKPQTARGLGYAGGAAGLMNPDTNLKYGMRYLAAAYKMSGGDTCATVMRYQSGHYAKRINAANRAYCAKARTIMASGD
jgi:soluble lytic murein transglycosylase-like protein